MGIVCPGRRYSLLFDICEQLEAHLDAGRRKWRTKRNRQECETLDAELRRRNANALIVEPVQFLCKDTAVGDCIAKRSFWAPSVMNLLGYPTHVYGGKDLVRQYPWDVVTRRNVIRNGS